MRRREIDMIKTKQVCKLLLSVIFIGSFLFGCENKTEKKITNSSEEIIKTEKIDLGEPYELVHDIQTMSDGKVRVGVSDENGFNSRIYEADEQGKKWEKISTLGEKIEFTNKDYLSFSLGAQGEIFVKLTKNASNFKQVLNTESEYFVIDKAGEMKELSVALEKVEETEEEHNGHSHESEHIEINSLNQVEFTQEGELVASDFGNHCYLIDTKTGKIQQKYKLVEEFEFAESLFSDDKYVYAYSTTGFLVYDKDSGKLVTNTQIEKVISEKLEEAYEKNTNLGPSMYQGEKADELYFTNALGIYHYDKLSETVKQTIGLSTLDIGLTENYARFLTRLNQESFLIAVSGSKGKTQNIYRGQKYQGEAAQKQKEDVATLKIWLLRESSELPRLVDSFKAQYPNVTLEVQIGIDGDSAHNVSDAISALNTKMLAKEGPDVLFLDNLPIDTYIEKEMLADLQPIYDELASEKQLFEKVGTTYKTDQGLFAIPQGFSFIGITAKEELSNQIETRAKLLDLLEKDRDRSLGVESAESLTSLLYYSSVQEWFDGKKVDKEKLTQFFEQYKRFYKVANLTEDKDIDFNKEKNFFSTGNFYLLEEKEVQNVDIAFDYIGSVASMDAIQLLNQLDYKTSLFNEKNGKQFIPSNVMGINSESKEEELANNFVKFLLSKDGGTSFGIPTNKIIYEKLLKEMSDKPLFGVDALTEDERRQTVEFLNSLESKVELNGVISETVIKQLKAYIFNGESLETVVNNAIKKIELYMAE